MSFRTLGEFVAACEARGDVKRVTREVDWRYEVTEIDYKERVVHYLGEGSGQIAYDQLVLACGVSANLDLVKGMAQHAANANAAAAPLVTSATAPVGFSWSFMTGA